MNHYYLAAAEHIEATFSPETGNHVYACHALNAVIPFGYNGSTRARHKDLFAKCFKPARKDFVENWFGAAAGYLDCELTPKQAEMRTKRKELRVLAMLFMHEITKGDYV